MEYGPPVQCSDCREPVMLHETPYRKNIEYVVTCDCRTREIDVSDAVTSSNLVEALTGAWSDVDRDG